MTGERQRSPSRLGRRLGVRRESLILLPVALLLLVVLSTFTLFTLKSALARLAEERREEAARIAGAAARQLAEVPSPTVEDLRRLAPPAAAAAVGLAVVDGSGRTLAASGDVAGRIPPGAAPGIIGDPGGDRPFALGPDGRSPGAVVGFAPLPGAPGRWLRADLPAAALAAQLRGARVLTVVVLGINSALVLLVLFSLGQILRPYETLLERARQVADLRESGEGEVEFLLGTFERAVAALAAPPGRAEDDIAALERTLSASLQSGLLLLDRAGGVLALNPVGAALLGIEAPEPGTPVAAALAGHGELLAVLSSAVGEERGVQRQECAVRAGGATLTLGLTVHPLRRDDGGVRGYLVLFADLTEVQRRAGEARLAESLTDLGEMAGGVAHELRNGLATLRGYLTLIARRPDEDSVADFLTEMRREADHLERVLADFLAFARPGTARPEELALGPLLARAAADPALAGVEVAVSAAGSERARLWGDPQLLERAVRNLLHNAAEAERRAGRNGPVEVSLEIGEEGVEVAIADRGPGIAPEVRERLFHPFATGRPGGVGLGLALAHRIVALHGGRLRLEDREGGGTRALLNFPVEAPLEVPLEAPAGERQGAAS